MADINTPWVFFGALSPTYPANAAFWFLLLMLPICVYAAWYDMVHLKIKNQLVILVAGIFLMLGPLLLPLDLYLFQLVQAVLILAFTFVLNMARAMGGGDAKFIAAASPFFMREDWPIIVTLAVVCILSSVVAHRTAKYTGAARLSPNWESWNSGKRFPAALFLGAIVVTYLWLATF